MLSFYILVFIVSCLMLFWSGRGLVKSLVRMGHFLGWREFVVAFIVIAFAASLPNLFVGISSALHGIPHLSFGDVVGGNLINLTIAVAIATLFSKRGLPARSRMVQTSAIFTIIIAVLPLLLILDGALTRGDGILLIFCFFFYLFWLFSKKERFSKIYNHNKKNLALNSFKVFIKDLSAVFVRLVFLLIAAEGIVRSAQFFAQALDLPIVLIGIFIVGFGNAAPEICFAVLSARKNQNWMILGGLMGSVIVNATLVLGVVAFICPIEILDFSLLAIARFFLVFAALFFFFSVRSDRKITKKEAVFLFSIYILFVAAEILIK